MNGSTSFYDNGLEDVILDNYLRLWEAVKNHVNMRVPKTPKKECARRIHTYHKKCIRCGTEYDTQRHGKKLCGDKLKHTGCAWLSVKEAVTKSRKWQN